MSEQLRRIERRIAAVPLPGRAVGTVLVVAFIAFGFFVGRVTRPKAAAARAVVEVQTPVASTPPKTAQPAAPAATPTPSAEGEGQGKGEGEGLPEEESSPRGASSQGSGGGGSGSGQPAGEPKGGGDAGGKSSPKASLTSIKHVFLIVLDDASYAEAFGPESKGPYLSHTLEKQGKLLERFYAIAHQQLPDGIALISGQGPTTATAEDCPVYEDLSPAKPAANGQVLGSGCVYPHSVQTVVGQLTAKHLTWRAYVQELGGGADEAAAGCAHPAIGAEDPTAALGMPAEATSPAGAAGNATAGSAAVGQPVGITSGAGSTGSVDSAGSASSTGSVDSTSSADSAANTDSTDSGEPLAGTFRDPFVYFHSIIDLRSCASDVVGVDRLKHDLESVKRTPNFSYIVPDLCEDGSLRPCMPGRPAGMAAADSFLKTVVPQILASPAYKQNGLLVITVDEAPTTGEYADSSSCCGQPSFPNLPTKGSSISGSGGGEVGALLLSPFVKGGGISQETYNDFSLLRTIEDIFSLHPLGYAGLKAVKPFSTSLFSAGG